MWLADLGNGTYRNPVLYADYSDPDVIRVGEDYYMIASSFSNAPAIPLLHSKDLVNWRVVNYVLDKIPEFRYRNPIHGCGVWAPAIRYHDGLFYVCFPMPDEGIYMTTAKDPFGKWSEPVNIRPKAGWIDPCPFWDDDGKAYLVAGVAKSRIGYKSVLHIVEMRPDGMALIGEEKVIFDGNTNGQETIEGPKLYKRNGWYYIFAPAGGVKTGWQTVLRSKNIYGPYEHKIVMKQGNSPVNGPHQGAWVDTVTGEDWFMHFQDVFAAGRIIHLQPVKWINDWPVIGINGEESGCGEPVMVYNKPNVGLNKSDIYEPDTTDEFDKNELGKQWQWNSNYEDDWISFKCDEAGRQCENGSNIRLNAVSATSLRPLSDYRNLLLQKWQSPEFTCIYKLNMGGLAVGDYAGVVSMGVNYLGMGIEKDDEKLRLKTVKGIQRFDCDQAFSSEEITYSDLPENFDVTKDIYFRYSVRQVKREDTKVNGIEVRNVPREVIILETSIDGINYTNTVSIDAKAGRWVGVKNGMFIMHDSKYKGGERGYITADYVRYS